MTEAIKELIRDIPDFPKPGILFKDITPLLADPKQFPRAIDLIARQFQNKGIDHVVCVEARGFIVGTPLAYKLGAGLVPVRKPGKLPYQTVRTTYELEYGAGSLEMHTDALKPGAQVLIADDLLATGGTTAAAIDLVKKLKAEVVGIAVLVELLFLQGRARLAGFDLFSLIQY